jgi:hypothetical protein
VHVKTLQECKRQNPLRIGDKILGGVSSFIRVVKSKTKICRGNQAKVEAFGNLEILPSLRRKVIRAQDEKHRPLDQPIESGPLISHPKGSIGEAPKRNDLSHQI